MPNMFPLLLGAGALALIVATKKKGNGAAAGGVVASGVMINHLNIPAEWRVVQGKLAGFADAPGFTAEIKLARETTYSKVSEHGGKEVAVDAAQTALIEQGFTKVATDLPIACTQDEEAVEVPPGSGNWKCIVKVKPVPQDGG